MALHFWGEDVVNHDAVALDAHWRSAANYVYNAIKKAYPDMNTENRESEILQIEELIQDVNSNIKN